MKTIVAIFFIILISTGNAGPLAPGVWTAMCGSCFTLTCLAFVPPSPAWVTCMISCCGLAPVLSLLACFEETTTVISESGPKLITDLKVGQRVLSQTAQGENKWTKVIIAQHLSGNYSFVQIHTPTKSLTVTEEHVMISDSKLIAAKDLKVGMMIQKQHINKLTFIKKDKKVIVITSEGTILANGILTTTVCGEYIDEFGNNLEVLEQWKNDHAKLQVK